MQLAIERATRCASFFDVECILSAEVGLSIPAAFVYNHEAVGMQMILAPSIVDSSGNEVRVRINSQGERAWPFFRRFNRSVTVAYLPSGRRAPVTEVFTDASAWCVQLLRDAYAESCWEQLD